MTAPNGEAGKDPVADYRNPRALPDGPVLVVGGR